jgi:PhnB protein
MPERSLIDRLDAEVDAILARPGTVKVPDDAELAELWRLAVDLLEQPAEDFRERLARTLMRKPGSHLREGLRSLTPYLAIRGADRLIEFSREAFGAVELLRVAQPDGPVQHAEVRIGDSVVEMGDRGDAPPSPGAIHLYVDDADAVYARALAAGAVSVVGITDMPYGDREGDVRDPFGNHWYIGTRREGGPIPAGLHSVTPVLHPREGFRLVEFLEQAFGAERVELHEAPPGRVAHAKLRIGDAVVEIGEAHGPFQPMPSLMHLYVEDADVTYRQALEAGATSLRAPEDTPYGDRSAAVVDPAGHSWFIATRLEDAEPQDPKTR